MLAGLRRYQHATRAAAGPAQPEVARVGRAVVRDYRATSGADAPAVLFVPSLINPPNVLDLDAETSLLRWLAARGLRPLLVDWGTPGADERALSIGGHVETLLVPLIDALAGAVPGPPTLAGYCLGGTMAIAAATLRPVRGLALLAAPWRFGGFPRESRAGLAELWARSGAIADALGLLPMEVLQAAFWQLGGDRTLTKYARFGRLADDDPELARFVALEDWANDGPPLTAAAARELVEDFITADITGAGRWQVGGRTIDPAALACPILDVVSTSDQIVPLASAAGVGRRLTLTQGHVGMIVGGGRDALREPLADWLSRPGDPG